MQTNSLYQSNYYWSLLLLEDQNFIGYNHKKTVQVTINSFGETVSVINFIDKRNVNFKTFEVLEAIDNARLKLYEVILTNTDAEQVKNNLAIVHFLCNY
jgi:hypothetical protein